MTTAEEGRVVSERTWRLLRAMREMEKTLKGLSEDARMEIGDEEALTALDMASTSLSLALKTFQGVRPEEESGVIWNKDLAQLLELPAAEPDSWPALVVAESARELAAIENDWDHYPESQPVFEVDRAVAFRKAALALLFDALMERLPAATVPVLQAFEKQLGALHIETVEAARAQAE